MRMPNGQVTTIEIKPTPWQKGESMPVNPQAVEALASRAEAGTARVLAQSRKV
jgi:hypothetical protein